MKKNMFIFIIMIVIFVVSCTVPIDPVVTYIVPWGGGAGVEPDRDSSSGAYRIEIPGNLAWVAEEARDKGSFNDNIIFINNIDMGNHDFIGIESYSGLMDGNNKKITGLNIENAIYAGLILHLVGGTVLNLTIENSYMSSTALTNSGGAGAFVGRSSGVSKLSGLINKADVSGSSWVIGGIIGFNGGTLIITDSENWGTITGVTAGGIIARVNGRTTISGVMNRGTITSVNTFFAGGILGYVDESSDFIKIDNAGNVGDIIGSTGGGGIVGYADFAVPINVSKSYNYGTIISNGNTKGAIVGVKNDNVTLTTTDSFYLTGSAGNAVGGVIPDEGAISTSIAGFKIRNTFTDWDFSTTWQMGAYYPTLR